VIDRVRPDVQDSIEVRGSTPIDIVTPFKDSVLTSSPLNTDDARLANAALLSELAGGGVLSTPARNYAQKVVKRSKRVQVRNSIIEEEHAKLKAAVTMRKTILSGKRQVIDGKHILTTPEILNGLTEVEKKTKKRKISGTKKGKRGTSRVVEDTSDESESSQDESLVILDCIVVE
jgi:hypothetical protein